MLYDPDCVFKCGGCVFIACLVKTPLNLIKEDVVLRFKKKKGGGRKKKRMQERTKEGAKEEKRKRVKTNI